MRMSDVGCGMSDGRRAGTGAFPRLAHPTSHIRHPTSFNGIICFGGQDWWYHNRGHFDMQLMRRLARRVPVVYLNSIGMRVPRASERGMFLRRVGRKLRSLSRGLEHVEAGLWAFSPCVAPAGLGGDANKRALAAQARWAGAEVGITRPLIWVACPPASEVAPMMDGAGMVYQRVDRYECYPGVDRQRVVSWDRRGKEDGDLTVFCSASMMSLEQDQCRNAAWLDHGVDAERFIAAGDGATAVPDDLAEFPRPRVGFVGGIDPHTFDGAMVRDVAARLPHVSFCLVGGCSIPRGWCELPNVHLLGQRDYEEIPAYMAACDALIMPWNASEWIRSCNPVKVKEYLAVGRPVVTTPFGEVERYRTLVRVASGAESFAAEIGTALRTAHDPRPGRALARGCTWESQTVRALELLGKAGLAIQERGHQTQLARAA